jgi:F-type H+-transporting ATPase subunit beta
MFIDNIGRFSQAGSDVSPRLGRAPSAMDHQPTLSKEIGDCQERIISSRDGSITSVHTSDVASDNLRDPAPANTLAYLDFIIVSTRNICAMIVYPAVDAVSSTCSVLSFDTITEGHFRVPRDFGCENRQGLTNCQSLN